MGAAVAIGEQLIDHPDRIGDVNALGLDETLFAWLGRFRTQSWSTQIVDVRRGQILNVVPGRTAVEPCRWLAARPQAWRDRIEWATLDLSNSCRSVFDTMLPLAVQVADPFHVHRLAHTDPDLADEWVAEIVRDFADESMPIEVRCLGRTIAKRASQIAAWHRSHVSNGPTEAVNNLAKRIKRVAFGLVNFRHHRVRCLLYAGKPDRTLLPTIQP